MCTLHVCEKVKQISDMQINTVNSYVRSYQTNHADSMPQTQLS